MLTQKGHGSAGQTKQHQETYFFGKDTLQQSLRLGFAGAWAHPSPSLSRRLGTIQPHCPNLASSFIGSSRAGLLEPTTEKRSKYVSDSHHTDISTFGQVSTERTNGLGVEIPTGFAQSFGEWDFFFDAPAGIPYIQCELHQQAL
jgi:hypothetical protein